MSTIEDIGAVIHVLRVTRGMSQGDLAKVSGVRNSSISNYERGKAIPKFETIQRLADGLELPLSAVEETQEFLRRMRSLTAELPAVSRPGGLVAPRETTVLLEEVEQVSGEAGRLVSRLTRLAFELLAAGIATRGEDPPPPAPASGE